jgi:hypothetical protein
MSAIGAEPDMRRYPAPIASGAFDPQRHRRANFAVTHSPFGGSFTWLSKIDHSVMVITDRLAKYVHGAHGGA